MGDSDNNKKINKVISSKNKNIDKKFKAQEEKYDFRNTEIKQYRKKAKTVLKKDLEKRFNKVTEKDYESLKITDERLNNRSKAYGTPHIIIELREIEKGKNKGKLEYVAKNFKTKEIESRVLKKESWTRNEHEIFLREEIAKKGFNYDKFYIQEDSEPIKKGDSNPNVTISYNTYFRYGIIIYRLKSGKRYEIIYRANDVKVIDRYVSFQRIIAHTKNDILKNTGITLEEWIYLSKTQDNLFLEGGLSYKRKKGIHHPDKRFKWISDYEQIIDFESI